MCVKLDLMFLQRVSLVSQEKQGEFAVGANASSEVFSGVSSNPGVVAVTNASSEFDTTEDSGEVQLCHYKINIGI